MAWRFRKSAKILGVRVNLSGKGVGVSVGGKGARIGVNSRGVYTSVSIPGTGLSNTEYLRPPASRGQVQLGSGEAQKSLAASESDRKSAPALNETTPMSTKALTGLIFAAGVTLGLVIISLGC